MLPSRSMTVSVEMGKGTAEGCSAEEGLSDCIEVKDGAPPRLPLAHFDQPWTATA
jgi:hypothetical protein